MKTSAIAAVAFAAFGFSSMASAQWGGLVVPWGYGPQTPQSNRPAVVGPDGYYPSEQVGSHTGTMVPHWERPRMRAIGNWAQLGLHRPPRGYQWMEYGDHYALVSRANGAIAQLLAR